MPKYTNETDNDDIQNQITKNIKNEENAQSVLVLISSLCDEVNTSADPMSQWLNLFSKNRIRASKWSTSADTIEIYPSGTKGPGKSDRLWFQVNAQTVKVVQAGASKH